MVKSAFFTIALAVGLIGSGSALLTYLANRAADAPVEDSGAESSAIIGMAGIAVAALILWL